MPLRPGLLSRPANRRLTVAQRIAQAAGGSANLAGTFLYGVNATSAGSTLSAWADANTNGVTLAQATGSKQPFDDGTSYTFDGVNDFMTATFTYAQPLTVMLVLSPLSWGATRNFVDGAALVDSMDIFQAISTPQVAMYAGSTFTTGKSVPLGAFAVITAVFNAASSKFQVNDATQATGNAGTRTPGGITIGANNDGTLHFSEISVKAAICGIGEFTAGQRTAIKNILYSTYGVTP